MDMIENPGLVEVAGVIEEKLKRVIDGADRKTEPMGNVFQKSILSAVMILKVFLFIVRRTCSLKFDR